ncbi:MAG: CinA family protein [Asgard group archaeon]|nr:CinA family protein [Asgard group archaeon]
MRINKQIVEILKDRGWYISTAESCSGGFLAHTITNASGSSDYFSYGYITYSDQAKIQTLNIQKNVLEESTSYSGKIAELMATGVRSKTESTFGLAITGIAPPGDPSSSLPTGTVFIGVSSSKYTTHSRFKIKTKSRCRFKRQVVKITLNLLEDIVHEYNKN